MRHRRRYAGLSGTPKVGPRAGLDQQTVAPVVAPNLTIRSRFVNARASRNAPFIVASVPEFTIRTISIAGTARRTNFASSVSEQGRRAVGWSRPQGPPAGLP